MFKAQHVSQDPQLSPLWERFPQWEHSARSKFLL